MLDPSVDWKARHLIGSVRGEWLEEMWLTNPLVIWKEKKAAAASVAPEDENAWGPFDKNGREIGETDEEDSDVEEEPYVLQVSDHWSHCGMCVHMSQSCVDSMHSYAGEKWRLAFVFLQD